MVYRIQFRLCHGCKYESYNLRFSLADEPVLSNQTKNMLSKSMLIFATTYLSGWIGIDFLTNLNI
jgi:hypothetical protein